MEEWVDDAAEALERLTRDRMANAYRGSVRILSASAPASRGRYQACTLELELVAEGLETETVSIELVFPRKHWPTPGHLLPARISRSEPREIEVNWDLLVR